MAINRSFGIHPGVAWAGPLPGGGYSGITARLDRAVLDAATWLERELNCDVVVRFNSHRESGGAFIADGARGRDIGLRVGFWSNGKRGFYFGVFASKDFLCDPSLADQGIEGEKYAAPDFLTARQCRTWFKRNVNYAKAIP